MRKYNMIVICIIAVIMLNYQYSHAFKPVSLTKNIAFELGAGYDQLFWKYPGGSNNRTAFSLSPSIKLLYDIPLNDKFCLLPFLGYNRIGGKSSKLSNGYRDEYWWNCIELGSFVNIKPKQYEFGIGLKANLVVKAIGKYYGGIDSPADSERSWSDENWTNEFAKISYDAGFRLGWRKKHLYSAIEAWLGFGNLVKGSIYDTAGGVKARENHFRILLGYRL